MNNSKAELISKHRSALRKTGQPPYFVLIKNNSDCINLSVKSFIDGQFMIHDWRNVTNPVLVTSDLKAAIGDSVTAMFIPVEVYHQTKLEQLLGETL